MYTPVRKVDDAHRGITDEHLTSAPLSYFLISRNNKALSPAKYRQLVSYLKAEIPCALVLFENEKPL